MGMHLKALGHIQKRKIKEHYNQPCCRVCVCVWLAAIILRITHPVIKFTLAFVCAPHKQELWGQGLEQTGREGGLSGHILGRASWRGRGCRCHYKHPPLHGPHQIYSHFIKPRPPSKRNKQMEDRKEERRWRAGKCVEGGGGREESHWHIVSAEKGKAIKKKQPLKLKFRHFTDISGPTKRVEGWVWAAGKACRGSHDRDLMCWEAQIHLPTTLTHCPPDIWRQNPWTGTQPCLQNMPSGLQVCSSISVRGPNSISKRPTIHS